MCHRFASDVSSNLIALCFRAIIGEADISPSWNIRPNQTARIIRRLPGAAQRSLDVFSWGLVPNFLKSPRHRPRLYAIETDRIARSRTTKDAFKSRRCLVPATAFYELAERPHAIAPADRVVMAMAGLWETWRHPETAEWHQTFALVTHSTAEGDGAARRPVIIQQADWPAWLGEQPASLGHLLAASRNTPWHRWAISRRIVNTDADDADLLVPFAPSENPAASDEVPRSCC